MKAKIQPVQFFKNFATLLQINSVVVNTLGESGRASISCSLIDEETSRHLASEVVILDGEAYSSWGSDDEYIINYVLEALGLNRLQDVVNSSIDVLTSDTVVDSTVVDSAAVDSAAVDEA
jgi:hypothetical protein